MGSACSGITDPDADEKKFRNHMRNEVLKSLVPDTDTLQAAVIEKNASKLKQLLQQNPQKINDLDHHGYTALHLAVLLCWNKGIDLLLSSYASPIVSSSSGWTVIDEAISTKQFKVYDKLTNALCRNFEQYSKQNVTKIYNELTQKTDFYIEIKFESFAKGFSGMTDQYFPSDVLKVWKRGSFVRVDMTLLDFDYDEKKWIHGNVSLIFMIKQNGTFDFYRIDHDEKSVDLQPNKPFLNYDNIHFDIFDKDKSERKKLLAMPVKSRKTEIKKAQFKRQRNWIGTEEEETINGTQCSVYKASDIEFITKYRNEHIPTDHRLSIKNDSSIMSLIMHRDEDEEKAETWTDYGVDEVECDYTAPTFSRRQYDQLSNGDEEIRESAMKNRLKFDEEESFLINTVNTYISKSSYNLSIFMTNEYNIHINEILISLELIGVIASHMSNVQRILQLTAYDEDRFPLCIEMPLFLNILRARITFQNLKREPVDQKIFQIPNYKR